MIFTIDCLFNCTGASEATRTHHRSMLKRAASVERKTVSAFILDKGLAAAAEALADRREFGLSAKQYDAFVAALDAPSKPRPRLERRLKTPSVLE